MSSKKRNYLPTAIAVYTTFFMCGIIMSISAQYKLQLAELWGEKGNIAAVLSVSSAVGVGGLIGTLAGPISDKFGRRFASIMACLCTVINFAGFMLAPNVTVAYICSLIGGIGNSFMNAGLTPSMQDAYPDKRSMLTVLTKFFVSMGQFVLPFVIVAFNASHISYKLAFWGLAVIYAIVGLACFFLPFPESGSQKRQGEKAAAPKVKMHITLEAVILGLMGFSTTALFMVWTNTNQELGKLYGLTNPALLQSVYAIASLVSVLTTSALVQKGLKESTVLTVYPAVTGAFLLLTYFIQSGPMVYAMAAVMGWFGAGGTMQLAVSLLAGLYPAHKATAISIVGLGNALSNWLVIRLCGTITATAGTNAPRVILLMNFVIAVIGVVFGLIVTASQKSRAKKGITSLEEIDNGVDDAVATE
ncbi:MFS transporter [Lactobacillus equicursoris]|uniref:MFS transporter n=1 Tax=Lactobacillus equicursoris TaxID=420645 RepID=UPI00242E441C|nr:MFS transporter [Lactobacillus equicursoris]MDD6386444.1 MFS transporter [Lactobacillus equicursoris]